MSEKSLSIKIRRARKELRIMQGEATNIYSYLTVIKNIDKNNHLARNICKFNSWQFRAILS